MVDLISYYAILLYERIVEINLKDNIINAKHDYKQSKP